MQPNPEGLLYEKRLLSLPKQTQMRPRIVRYFPAVSMRNGHNGLSKIADKHGIDIGNLGWGEFIVFTNKDQTALKMFAQGNVIAHLKMPGSKRIDPRTIAILPRFFSGKELNYEGAVEEVIKREFRTRA